MAPATKKPQVNWHLFTGLLGVYSKVLLFKCVIYRFISLVTEKIMERLEATTQCKNKQVISIPLESFYKELDEEETKLIALGEYDFDHPCSKTRYLFSRYFRSSQIYVFQMALYLKHLKFGSFVQVKPAFEEFCQPTKKWADVIIPRGGENDVAIDLLVQHIQDLLRTPRGSPELQKNRVDSIDEAADAKSKARARPH
uniref:PIPK domain-containing protein n=1 Tax=Heterorhabditis bacteriophora TaxID=37862 RepID=A0A1I7X5Z1_HETBA